jgi:hypothetical protein
MKSQPSEETKRKMAEFFMKTSIPRILAAIERGELTWDDVVKKEVTANAQRSHQANCAHN